MADRALQHRRLHNLLLIQKLLGLRGESSPFTLVLDTVEQSAKPLIRHYIHNAKLSKIDVVYISFETLKPPPGVTTFIKARRKDAATIQKEIASAVSTTKRTLLIIDTLYPLATTPTTNLPSFLSALLTTTPHTTLLATYHTDVPIPIPLPLPQHQSNPYAPTPLTSLAYLATTILTPHNPSHILAQKQAADRSLPEPAFGLAEGREGVIVGMGNAASAGIGGCVLEMNHRRKSGRGIEETFFLPSFPSFSLTGKGKGKDEEKVILLDDHPLFRRLGHAGDGDGDGDGDGNWQNEVKALSTFDLGITERQRRDREGVVLPYFDAQSAAGGGEGGRILYEMGAEDDFDEEEDEI